jgi:FKBP-type peptidyl-prolyl cis-trans isomerase
MLQIKGGAFAGDTDLLRFTLGDGTVIPGLAEGVAGMKEGGVRQVCI